MYREKDFSDKRPIGKKDYQKKKLHEFSHSMQHATILLDGSTYQFPAFCYNMSPNVAAIRFPSLKISFFKMGLKIPEEENFTHKRSTYKEKKRDFRLFSHADMKPSLSLDSPIHTYITDHKQQLSA